jgi:hypothetical protein
MLVPVKTKKIEAIDRSQWRERRVNHSMLKHAQTEQQDYPERTGIRPRTER